MILASLLSFNVHANTNCGVKLTLQDVSWTGECKDGYANGIGLFSYKYMNKNNKLIAQETFGKIIDGKFTGLHLVTPDTEKPVYRFVKYYKNGYESAVGPTIVTGTDNMNLLLHQRTWADVNAEPDENNKQPVISYEKALTDIKIYIAQRNEPSVDFEVFKAYLEGRVRVEGEDDPPVLGAALKPGSGKKKK